MNRSRTLIGAGLVLLGALFLLDSLGLIVAGDVISDWWPLAIVGLGVYQLLGKPVSRTGPYIIIAVGLLALAASTGLLDAAPAGLFWPLVLIGAGVWMAFGRDRSTGQRPRFTGRGAASTSPDGAFDVVTLFSDRRVTGESAEFSGGSLVTIFGDVDLDLSRTGLGPEGGRLDITAVFGDIDIEVPTGWRVRFDGLAIFGSFRDRTTRNQTLPLQAPTLAIRGVSVFADVKVRAVPAAVET